MTATVGQAVVNGTRRRSGRRAIKAAAIRLDDFAAGHGELHRQLARTEQWQRLSLGFYDTIGEVHYGVTSSADALAKGRLFVGVRTDPEAPLMPVDDPDVLANPDFSITQQIADIAMAKLRDLKAPVGGQAQIVRMAAMNRDLCGEWFLLHYNGPEERLWGWHVRSVDDIKVESDRVTSVGLGEFPLEQVSRVWNPHPRRFEAADCGMRGVLGQCETVLLIDRQFRAALRSRLFAGLLLLSNEFRQGTPDETTETAGDGEATDDPVINDILEALSTGIQDEGSASAVVPNTLYGTTDAVKDGARLLSFAQQIDPQVLALRDSSLRRVAQGLDQPAESIMGIGDVNHWNAWFVGESFAEHIMPRATFLVDALTTVYLRPECEGEIDPDVLATLEVGIDLSALMRRQNGDQDARDAYDRGEINGEGLRRALAISEQFAPTEDDTVRWLILNKATLGPNLLAELLRRVIAPDLPTTVDTGIGGVPSVPPTAVEPNSPPVGAAAGVPIAASASALVDIDRSVTERLYAALLTTFRRALERAGNRARSRVAASFRPRSADVPAEQVVCHVGPAVLAAAGVTDEELLVGAMDQLRPDFDRWVRDAQAAALAAALALAAEMSDEDPDPGAVEDFTARQAADREAAWEWLAAAASAVLLAHLNDGKPLSDWEARALARQALARAGGTDTLASTASGQSAETVPQGGGLGLATGAAIIGLLSTLGAKPSGWEWVHGEPDHPYPDHVDLNGRVEQSEDGFDGWWPGDHDGCTCETVPTFAETE